MPAVSPRTASLEDAGPAAGLSRPEGPRRGGVGPEAQGPAWKARAGPGSGPHWQTQMGLGAPALGRRCAACLAQTCGGLLGRSPRGKRSQEVFQHRVRRARAQPGLRPRSVQRGALGRAGHCCVGSVGRRPNRFSPALARRAALPRRPGLCTLTAPGLGLEKPRPRLAVCSGGRGRAGPDGTRTAENRPAVLEAAANRSTLRRGARVKRKNPHRAVASLAGDVSVRRVDLHAVPQSPLCPPVPISSSLGWLVLIRSGMQHIWVYVVLCYPL